MKITRANPVLPQAGDTVTYNGKEWMVVAFDFTSDDLTIRRAERQTTINRLDID